MEQLPAMISYAQNTEDVILRRAFAQQSRGFYIDVGAANPVDHSVTKHFYDAGWHGINIEPQPNLLASLVSSRPRDVNLNCAVGTAGGVATLTIFPKAWGWATLNAEVIQQHAGKAKAESTNQIQVAVRSLDDILAECKPPSIDFLKVDVEGSEMDVLRSLDFTKWQPRVIVVEATLPDSTVESTETWEPILIGAGYRSVFFDGLNRYYVQTSEEALARILSVPANTFDRYIPYRFWKELTAAKQVRLATEFGLAIEGSMPVRTPTSTTQF